MINRKLLKKRKRFKDYKKKSNILKQQIKEIGNGTRTGFSITLKKQQHAKK
jgi:hypothetical protein